MSELGKELNGAIFAVITEGKVKLYDDDHWYAREYKPKKKLPQQKTPGLKVEAIDLSGTNVIYEGLENLCKFTFAMNLGCLSIHLSVLYKPSDLLNVILNDHLM